VGTNGKDTREVMTSSLPDFLKEKLSKRIDQGILRTLVSKGLASDFVSNDYLGLARSGELAEMIESTQRSLGVQNGSSGSRLLSGNSRYTEDVEKNLSKIFKSEAALILNSGYSANLAVLSSIPQKGDTIIYDNLSHASIKDGARLSLANRYSFGHNDIADLESKITLSKGRVFIVIESVYSMDGDQCPLQEITRVAKKYGACVILDEAHSTGVTGPLGGGLAVSKNLQDEIDIRIYTFGKALGVHGACVVGSESLIQYLINFGRPFIYTTALSQHSVVSIQCAFNFLADNLFLQEVLQKKIDLFLSDIKDLTNRTVSHAAIQTMIFPGNNTVKQAASSLQKKGFDVRPIVHPTVPKGTERLRICLHTFNTDAEIISLTTALNELV
jgi:8-amino-7-oxononanoate synthase